jgi:hypothetical protein
MMDRLAGSPSGGVGPSRRVMWFGDAILAVSTIVIVLR